MQIARYIKLMRRLSMPPMVVPELSYSSCMGTPNTPPRPLDYAPHPDLLEDSYHDIIMGDFAFPYHHQ